MIRKIYANGVNEIEFLNELEKRSGETDKRVAEIVSEIIDDVKANGDDAVSKYTLKFDGSLPEYYEVPREVINDALTEADRDFVNAFKCSGKYHRFSIDKRNKGLLIQRKMELY